MDREFWECFLSMYKMHNCLWDTTSPEYSLRSCRNMAYDDIAEFCKTRYPSANRDFVVKKIHHFRCGFRREHKKVLQSNVAASPNEQIYRPTLWYYNLLLFITDYLAPIKEEEMEATNESSEENNNIESIGQQQSHSHSCNDIVTVDEPEDDKGEIQKMIINQKVRYEPTLVEKDNGIESKNQDSFPTISINGKRTIRDNWDGNNFAGTNNTVDCTSSQNFYSGVGNRSSSPSVLSEDEFDIAGKKLSVDLRSLNFKQRVIAEKLIGDAIFYGKLGKLNENCQIQFPY